MENPRVDTDYRGRTVRTSFSDEEFEAVSPEFSVDCIVVLDDGSEAVQWEDGKLYPIDESTGRPDFNKPITE